MVLSMSDNRVNDMKRATESDSEFQSLIQIVLSGWPNHHERLSQPLKKFWNFRDEIFYFDGLLFKGQKVMVPAEQMPVILNQLHKGHFGIQRTLALAREHVFWVGMTADVTNVVQRCSALCCLSTDAEVQSKRTDDSQTNSTVSF